MTFKNDEEVIRMANDSKYGLTASIWTKDIENAKHMASQIESEQSASMTVLQPLLSVRRHGVVEKKAELADAWKNGDYGICRTQAYTCR